MRYRQKQSRELTTPHQYPPHSGSMAVFRTNCIIRFKSIFPLLHAVKQNVKLYIGIYNNWSNSPCHCQLSGFASPALCSRLWEQINKIIYKNIPDFFLLSQDETLFVQQNVCGQSALGRQFGLYPFCPADRDKDHCSDDRDAEQTSESLCTGWNDALLACVSRTSRFPIENISAFS